MSRQINHKSGNILQLQNAVPEHVNVLFVQGFLIEVRLLTARGVNLLLCLVSLPELLPAESILLEAEHVQAGGRSGSHLCIVILHSRRHGLPHEGFLHSKLLCSCQVQERLGCRLSHITGGVREAALHQALDADVLRDLLRDTQTANRNRGSFAHRRVRIPHGIRQVGGGGGRKRPDPSQRNGGAASDDMIRISQCLEQLGHSRRGALAADLTDGLCCGGSNVTLAVSQASSQCVGGHWRTQHAQRSRCCTLDFGTRIFQRVHEHLQHCRGAHTEVSQRSQCGNPHTLHRVQGGLE
mmetsp:Transcript_47241/g.110392  ORF Transcript_47241/g.110392 Transcript_47241/m.110392 type:complete len:296 (-) Transcript_47241:154-1041(-)